MWNNYLRCLIMLYSPEMTVFQLNKLRSLIRHVYIHVPYYRRVFRSIGLLPEDINSFDDYRRIPIITKEEIRNHWDEFISDEFEHLDRRLIARYTSGSSGDALKVVKTYQERIVSGRHFMKARMKRGLILPTRCVAFGGSPYFIENQGGTIRMGNMLVFSGLHLSEDTIHRYIKDMIYIQPNWIYSLPSIIDVIAKYIIEKGITLSLSNLQLIELAGEYLSEDVRERVKRAFNVSPASQYACQEVWGISFECSANLMHVIDDNIYLEVERSDGYPAKFGEEGESIVTSFTSRTMPFIRYNTRDIVAFIGERCACGSNKSIIRMIGGRTTDYVLGCPGKVGNIIFDTTMKYIQDKHDIEVIKHRVVQLSVSEFEIWVSSKSIWDDTIKQTFIESATSLLENQASFVFRFVEELPEHKSGKRRSFIIDAS
jgi:phenylacetate-CoA ligase